MIDARIALGIRPPEFESPMNRLTRMLQLDGLQQANQLNAMQMRDYEANAQERNRLRDLARVQAQRDEEFVNSIPSPQGQALQALGADASPTLANAARMPKVDPQQQFLYEALRARQIKPMEFMAAMQPKALKLKSVEPMRDPSTGKLVNIALFEDGTTKVLPYGVKPEIVLQQLGNRVAALDKNELPQNASFEMGQSPDNAATVGASLANAAATRDAAKTQAQATRDAATIQTGFQNETALRKEFEGLPEIKNYKQAFPAYAAVKDASSRNTTQSDINIVYGLAKLYDPTSVVREGEYATVANSPNIPERIKGYAQYLQGGGKLSPETKRQILAEASGRIQTYKAEADKAKGSYENIAKRRGIDPSSVFQDMGDMGTQPSGSGLQDAAAAELRRRQGGK